MQKKSSCNTLISPAKKAGGKLRETDFKGRPKEIEQKEEAVCCQLNEDKKGSSFRRDLEEGVYAENLS